VGEYETPYGFRVNGKESKNKSGRGTAGRRKGFMETNAVFFLTPNFVDVWAEGGCPNHHPNFLKFYM
jgi:hypothetical protein